MNVAALEAALPALVISAADELGPDVAQVYVADRPRADGNTLEFWIEPRVAEPTSAAAWGIGTRDHMYRYHLLGSSLTRASARTILEQVATRIHGRRAPATAGHEVAIVDAVTVDEIGGQGAEPGPISAFMDVRHRGDLRPEEGSSG